MLHVFLCWILSLLFFFIWGVILFFITRRLAFKRLYMDQSWNWIGWGTSQLSSTVQMWVLGTISHISSLLQVFDLSLYTRVVISKTFLCSVTCDFILKGNVLCEIKFIYFIQLYNGEKSVYTLLIISSRKELMLGCQQQWYEQYYICLTLCIN